MIARRLTTGAVLAALLVGPAHAHLVATGMGPLYDGIAHFALSLEDVALVIALGCYAGLRGQSHTRLLLGVLPMAWAIGAGLAAFLLVRLPEPALFAAGPVLFLATGGLLAANLPLSPSLCMGLALALGLLCGAADLSGAARRDGLALTILGVVGAVFVTFALTASVTLPLRQRWAIVAVRAMGSWLAAAGLLWAGWVMRYGSQAL